MIPYLEKKLMIAICMVEKSVTVNKEQRSLKFQEQFHI